MTPSCSVNLNINCDLAAYCKPSTRYPQRPRKTWLRRRPGDSALDGIIDGAFLGFGMWAWGFLAPYGVFKVLGSHRALEVEGIVVT